MSEKVFELDNGYPTDETLDYIGNCNVRGTADFDILMTEIGGIWTFPEYFHKNEYGNWEVHTGGWSGNESIIAALYSNDMLWAFYWLRSTAGGHYVFGRHFKNLDYREDELRYRVGELLNRVSELKEEVERLIKAGNALDVPPDDFSEEQKEWRELVSEWKEREK